MISYLLSGPTYSRVSRYCSGRFSGGMVLFTFTTMPMPASAVKVAGSGAGALV